MVFLQSHLLTSIDHIKGGMLIVNEQDTPKSHGLSSFSSLKCYTLGLYSIHHFQTNPYTVFTIVHQFFILLGRYIYIYISLASLQPLPKRAEFFCGWSETTATLVITGRVFLGSSGSSGINLRDLGRCSPHNKRAWWVHFHLI